jgi:aspartyl-tRNA(Asn)/glutamyl-tRNA(Gln) amidotransferase subunit A
MTRPLHERSVAELRAGLAAGEFTSRQLVETYLGRIGAYNSRINGFVTVLAEQALEQADAADRKRSAGEALGPLAGIPIGVKDSVPTAGIRTTSNSRVLENWVPEHDAVAVRHLRDAGAILLGKTNLNEFGWALPNDKDLTPKALSSWNPAYAAIGSSSGSGTTVSAGFLAASVGTDGGGSARLPAGQNNLVSIKATHGLISREGMDDSWISDIAPMTRTVEDTALMLAIMAGRNAADRPSWEPAVPDYVAGLDVRVAGWRVGVPRRLIDESGMEDEVAEAFEASLAQLRALGVELVDIDIPGLSEARVANFVILNGQTYAAHAVSLRRQRERYGHSARVYHWMGAFLSASDLLNAKAVALRVRGLVQDVFRDVRAFVTPTSPVVTAEAARKPDSHRKGSNAMFTSPFNATGHPAISVPSGFSASTGLPIGVQMVGALHDELTLLQLARALEGRSNWRERSVSFD